MGRTKIPHPTCEHAVFGFLPAYPDTSGVSAPIGESGYEGAEECVAKVGADRRDAHRETEERCQFSVIPVFSRAAARFGQDIGNTSGLFLILRGFAPLREIHGGGYAAQVGRFGETTPPVFIHCLKKSRQRRADSTWLGGRF